VLLVVAHPTIGAALATLIEMEGRYEVLRVQSLELADAMLRRWKPQAALVDGLLLQNGTTATLAVPTFVLSGSAIEGDGLARRLPDGRGWVRKDATADELRAAIDSVVAPPRASLRRRGIASLGAAVAALVVIATLLLWLLFGAH